MPPIDYKFLKQDLSGTTEEALLYFVFVSYEVLGKEFEDYFKKEFQLLPSHTHLLCYLKLYGIMSMSDLAELMNTSRQHMTKIVDSLAERGLVTRTYNPRDRRAVYVEPTDQALRQVDTGERRFISHLLHNISQLPEDEQEKTIDAIKTTSKFLSSLTIKTEKIPNSYL